MNPRQTSRPAAVAAAAGLLLTTAACAGSGHAATSSTSSTYRPGDYHATGSYTDPGGRDSIDVDVTLTANGTMSTVKVTPLADDANCKKFQDEFAAGIGAIATGRKLGELKVAKVSGSSLTSHGFNAALAEIAAKARA